MARDDEQQAMTSERLAEIERWVNDPEYYFASCDDDSEWVAIRDLWAEVKRTREARHPLSEGSTPLTPERAMRMERTTHFVMSAVAATPDCPVLFVDVGEGFLSLAHMGDIDRLIQETKAPLLADNERLRAALDAKEAREAQWREIKRAVAYNEYRVSGESGLCEYLLCLPGDLREQSRALLAGEQAPGEA